jgi:protein translocase SecG subunit
MKDLIFNSIQIILGVFIIFIILLQQKGAGLSGVFGGSSNVYSTKRGVDKILHYSTIIIGILFFGIALVRLAI